MAPTWKTPQWKHRQPKKKKKGIKDTKEEETSRWWFSDEDLQEAIANIVDVPPRGHGRRAEPSDNEEEE